jgi:transcriptional regulator with XRE-family HTH domain
MDTIGSRIKEERARLGLSQEKMASAGGVQKRAQARYESDERCPDGLYLSAIAQIGADVQYILIGVRGMRIEDNDMPNRKVGRKALKMAEIFDELDDTVQQEILSTVQRAKQVTQLTEEVNQLRKKVDGRVAA